MQYYRSTMYVKCKVSMALIALFVPYWPKIKRGARVAQWVR